MSEYRLGDILELKYGKDHKALLDGDIPVYGSGGIMRYANTFLYDKESILIPRKGTLNNIFYLNGQQAFWTVDTIFWSKINTALVFGKFLFYYLKTIDFANLNVGSAVPSLTTKVLNEIDISLPPLKEQKAIAEVLSSLDDKIDLLHRQNKTLEALAQTLFRQWFIEEGGDDWEEGTLEDIIDFNPTHSLKKGEMYPFLEMGNVQTFKSSVADWYDRKFTSGTKFKNSDTLLARITPSLENGKTAYVNFLKDNEIGWGSTEFIVMRMKEGYHPFISYLVARNEDFREFAIGNMTGSTGRQRAQAKDIKEYEIAIPPIEIIKKLNEGIMHIPIKIKANSKQIKILENMRDTLLPKLMSGEVRMKNA